VNLARQAEHLLAERFCNPAASLALKVDQVRHWLGKERDAALFHRALQGEEVYARQFGGGDLADHRD
jgi:hypothetical protein